MTEKRLKALFEYQRFENNKSLSRLINETENRYRNELSDDDLEFVNAAGTPEFPSPTIDQDKPAGNIDGNKDRGTGSNGGGVYTTGKL